MVQSFLWILEARESDNVFSGVHSLHHCLSGTELAILIRCCLNEWSIGQRKILFDVHAGVRIPHDVESMNERLIAQSCGSKRWELIGLCERGIFKDDDKS